jgi:hypothetical protein
MNRVNVYVCVCTIKEVFISKKNVGYIKYVMYVCMYVVGSSTTTFVMYVCMYVAIQRR